MNLDIIILNKRQILCAITYMWNLKEKNYTSELICKTDSQTEKTNMSTEGERGRDKALV